MKRFTLTTLLLFSVATGVVGYFLGKADALQVDNAAPAVKTNESSYLGSQTTGVISHGKQAGKERANRMTTEQIEESESSVNFGAKAAKTKRMTVDEIRDSEMSIIPPDAVIHSKKMTAEEIIESENSIDLSAAEN